MEEKNDLLLRELCDRYQEKVGIESVGAKVKFLPPYSPDLSPIEALIEKCWSWLKSRIRKKLDQFDCLRDAIEDVLHFAS